MGYDVSQCNPDSIVGKAIGVASDGCKEIDAVLTDIRTDSDIEASVADNGDATLLGSEVLGRYGINTSGQPVGISNAAGAMVVDDLMQKISTKVQVAAQMLATSNNIAKMVARKLDQ